MLDFAVITTKAITNTSNIDHFDTKFAARRTDFAFLGCTHAKIPIITLHAGNRIAKAPMIKIRSHSPSLKKVTRPPYIECSVSKTQKLVIERIGRIQPAINSGPDKRRAQGAAEDQSLIVK
jgi:hypothetical protein